MPNLTITHLKHLLDQATPAPWEAIKTYPDGTPRPDTSRQIRSAAGEYMGLMHEPDVHLAALAPQLAEEVLRMRLDLYSAKIAWEIVLTDPERTPTEQALAEHVLGHIDNVLGETND